MTSAGMTGRTRATTALAGQAARRNRWPAGTLAAAGTIPARTMNASATLVFSQGHHPANHRSAIPTRPGVRGATCLPRRDQREPARHARRHPPHHLPDHPAPHLTVIRRLPPEIWDPLTEAAPEPVSRVADTRIRRCVRRPANVAAPANHSL
jgi:hypothetical protein